jgi:hypothetical protein
MKKKVNYVYDLWVIYLDEFYFPQLFYFYQYCLMFFCLNRFSINQTPWKCSSQNLSLIWYHISICRNMQYYTLFTNNVFMVIRFHGRFFTIVNGRRHVLRSSIIKYLCMYCIHDCVFSFLYWSDYKIIMYTVFCHIQVLFCVIKMQTSLSNPNHVCKLNFK